MQRHFFMVLVLSGFLSSCTKQEDIKNTFTMSTGVSIAEVKTCSDTPKFDLSVQKSSSDYVVTTTGAFSCESEVMKPYLTIPNGKKATLVIQSDASKSSCECFRSVTVKISDRLEPGDVLYVLNSGEVIGHVALP